MPSMACVVWTYWIVGVNNQDSSLTSPETLWDFWLAWSTSNADLYPEHLAGGGDCRAGLSPHVVKVGSPLWRCNPRAKMKLDEPISKMVCLLTFRFFAMQGSTINCHLVHFDNFKHTQSPMWCDKFLPATNLICRWFRGESTCLKVASCFHDTLLTRWNL